MEIDACFYWLSTRTPPRAEAGPFSSFSSFHFNTLYLSLALSLANAAVMQVNLKPPSVARYQFDVRWPIPITSLLIKPALHFLALVALAISRTDTIGSLLQLS